MSTSPTPTPEQLTLLATAPMASVDVGGTPDHVPVQFRLDRRTRQRGLAHIAELKSQLAARAAARSTQAA